MEYEVMHNKFPLKRAAHKGWIQMLVMDLGDAVKKFWCWNSLSGNLGLRLLWYIIHFILRIWHFLLGVAHTLESYLISSGFLRRYKTLDIGKIRYLAIAIDSRDAQETSKVLVLLRWLAEIGVKSICLYDTDGVLKMAKKEIMEGLSKLKISKGTSGNNQLSCADNLTLEFISCDDGKAAVAKAANFLFLQHYSCAAQQKLNLTESQMNEALEAVGCGRAEPDLLLIYGPVRCHLGFPAWRIRYTEIVHIGPLRSMKFGALIKAIHRYTLVHQNYGT